MTDRDVDLVTILSPQAERERRRHGAKTAHHYQPPRSTKKSLNTQQSYGRSGQRLLLLVAEEALAPGPDSRVHRSSFVSAIMITVTMVIPRLSRKSSF
jgi:hypothetical protein